jgi:hypothetical protein
MMSMVCRSTTRSRGAVIVAIAGVNNIHRRVLKVLMYTVTSPYRQTTPKHRQYNAAIRDPRLDPHLMSSALSFIGFYSSISGLATRQFDHVGGVRQGLLMYRAWMIPISTVSMNLTAMENVSHLECNQGLTES